MYIVFFLFIELFFFIVFLFIVLWVGLHQAARRASLGQGAGLLRAAQAMFPLDEQCGRIITEFRAMVRGGLAHSGTGLVETSRSPTKSTRYFSIKINIIVHLDPFSL